MRLSEQLGAPDVAPSRPGFAPLTNLERAATRVLARWSEVTPAPPERDRDAVAERAMDYAQGRRPWPARMSWMLGGMRAAFDAEPGHDPRRERPRLQPLRDFFVREIAVSTRPGFLGAACETYLDTYAPGAGHTVALGVAVEGAVLRLSARWRSLFAALPEMLDPREGSARLARRIAGEVDPVAVLRAAGVREIAKPAFFDHVQRALVASLRDSIGDGSVAACATLTSWLRGDGKVRERGAREAVAALLLPWVARQPSPTVRTFIQSELLDLYGDPRLGEPVWSATDDRAKAVMLGWLVAASLKLFLDVVTKAEEGSHNDQWRRRNPFWLQMLERKLVQDACVVLAPKAYRIAQSMAAASGDGAMARWVDKMPRIGGGDTSLLIMRINGKTVVEGSHSYKVLVFPRGHGAEPPTHSANYRYDPVTIRRSLAEAHKQEHWGAWEEKVEALVRK